ncbi:MAG: ABC transporter permease [Chloroflexi bacterium]|nr:ABC transporter permease [Chloroflexota bacterium]
MATTTTTPTTAAPTTTLKAPPKIFRTPQARRVGSILAWLFPFACLLTAWYFLAASGTYPRNFLPSPLAVWEALRDNAADGTLWKHISASLSRLSLGIVVSLLMGVSVGMIMGLNRGVAEFFEPLTSFMNALSGIAWVPLAIVWFGLGQGAVTFILWNSIFFLVMFNTLLGVKAVPRVFMNACLTMGGSKWRVVRDVMLPGAMPNIILGIRMGIGFGWRALIAAEMIGATSGLGFMIFDASYFHRSDVILSGIMVIGVIWLATDRLILSPLERRTIERWGLINKPA